jgi:hypothetical protein
MRCCIHAMFMRHAHSFAERDLPFHDRECRGMLPYTRVRGHRATVAYKSLSVKHFHGQPAGWPAATRYNLRQQHTTLADRTYAYSCTCLLVAKRGFSTRPVQFSIVLRRTPHDGPLHCQILARVMESPYRFSCLVTERA